MKRNRRELFKDACLSAASVAIASSAAVVKASDPPLAITASLITAQPHMAIPIIDTNIHLFQWPFRRLPHDEPQPLAKKLRQLGIQQAWAGSFEAILHRDITSVNSRLVSACRQIGNDLFHPIGSINITLPDWQEDLRRCHEVHEMFAIRVYPGYHGYRLEDEAFEQLVESADQRRMLIQLVVSLEDTRTQHPLMRVEDVDLTILPDLVSRYPGIQIMLLNHQLRGSMLERLIACRNVYLDTARIESIDGIAKLIESVGTERVLFSSHSPFLITESSLIRIDENRLAMDIVTQIMTDNAKRLKHSAIGPSAQKSPPTEAR